MSEVANLYDNGPISPIVKIKNNISVWTSGRWEHFSVKYIEPMPRSAPLVVEPVALSGATTIGAYGTIQKQIMDVLELARNEMLHLRWYPIDDMEGILWEQSSQGRFSSRGATARVDLMTPRYDPWLATTTFWIMGENRDMNLEVRNPNPIALPQARFAFFGYRYLLEQVENQPVTTTWIPAEGRQA